MTNSNENPLNAHLLNPDSNPTYIYICMNASLTYRIFETNNLLSYGKLFDYLKNSIINSISVLRGPWIKFKLFLKKQKIILQT